MTSFYCVVISYSLCFIEKTDKFSQKSMLSKFNHVLDPKKHEYLHEKIEYQ
jgi:hypothetical protein